MIRLRSSSSNISRNGTSSHEPFPEIEGGISAGSLAALGKRALKALLNRDPEAFRRKCLHGLWAPAAIPQNTAYRLWREKHELTDLDRQRIQRNVAELERPR